MEEGFRATSGGLFNPSFHTCCVYDTLVYPEALNLRGRCNFLTHAMHLATTHAPMTDEDAVSTTRFVVLFY